MNTYPDSFGNRWTTDQINRKSDKSAKELLEEQYNEHGYNFCSKCKRNDDVPIDVSHTISKDYAKKNSCVEKIWDKNNMEILGRSCHKLKDGLELWN